MSKAGYAFTKAGQASDATAFVTGVAKVMTGENFSGNPEELTGDVDDVYDGHIEALEGTRDLIGKTFKKVDCVFSVFLLLNLMGFAPYHQFMYESHPYSFGAVGTLALGAALEHPKRELFLSSLHSPHHTHCRNPALLEDISQRDARYFIGAE